MIHLRFLIVVFWGLFYVSEDVYKRQDVDIVAELQKLVDSHVDSYKEDFDIDKRIIRRAAESQNPEDKTLMWLSLIHI